MDTTRTTKAGVDRETGAVFGRTLSLRLLGTLSLLVLVATAAFALFTLAPAVAGASQATPPAQATMSAPVSLPLQTGAWPSNTVQPEYRVALLSSSAKLQGKYVTVEGTVQNLTDRHLPGLLAVVTLYGQDGTVIGSGDALIQKDPLPAGEISTFRVTLKEDPEAPFFGVRFQEWHVGSVPTRDDRQR